MLVDEDINVRKDAVRKIISARQNPDESDSVRKFMKPNRSQINEDAKKYFQILRWDLIQRK